MPIGNRKVGTPSFKQMISRTMVCRLAALGLLGSLLGSSVEAADNAADFNPEEFRQDVAELAPEIFALTAGHLAHHSEEPFSAFLRFDLNSDGQVDASDAKLLPGHTDYDISLDLDGDGTLDDVDQWWLELLVGDGTTPGWGFLDYDADGAISLSDYELPIDSPDHLQLVVPEKTTGSVALRPVTRVSLAHLTAFGPATVDWETVVRPRELSIRPMTTDERAALRQQPEMAEFADRSIWTTEPGTGAVAIDTLLFAVDPATGEERILFEFESDSDGNPMDLLLTPDFVFNMKSGTFLRVHDPANSPVRKGSIETLDIRFAAVWDLFGQSLVPAAQAQQGQRYQILFVRKLAELRNKLRRTETELEGEFIRILAELETLRKESDADPCKRLDCSALAQLYRELLSAETQVRQSARLARVMVRRFDKRWDDERNVWSAMQKGYYKQDLILTYQKSLIVISDVLALDFSKAETLINNLITSQVLRRGGAEFLKRLGVSEVGGVSLSEVISGTISSGIRIDTRKLTKDRFKLVRNGFARDLKRLRRTYKEYGAKGLPKATTRSRHLAGLLRNLLKAYANKSVRDVEGRRSEARTYADNAAADMVATQLAYASTRSFARDAAFLAQRLAYLQSRLRTMITECLNEGAAKDCHRAYLRAMAAIEAKQGTAVRAAELKSKQARATRDAAQRGFNDALAKAQATHRDLVAARNVAGPSAADLRRQIDHQKRLLGAADERLADIRRQESEFNVDLGASRMRWARAKLDARNAIAKLSQQLESASRSGGPKPEELKKRRAEAWKAVDANRSQLPDLRRAFREAQRAEADARQALADAVDRAKSTLQDCVLKGAGHVDLPARTPGTTEPGTGDLFVAEDITGPAQTGLTSALATARSVKLKLVTIEDCDRRTAASPANDALAKLAGEWRLLGGRLALRIEGETIVGRLSEAGDYLRALGYEPDQLVFRAQLGERGIVGEYLDRATVPDTPSTSCPDQTSDWRSMTVEGDVDTGGLAVYLEEIPSTGHDTCISGRPVPRLVMLTNPEPLSAIDEPGAGASANGVDGETTSPFSGLWEGFYGSTIRVNVVGSTVTGLIENPTERVEARGYHSGLQFIDAQLQEGKIIGTVVVPLSWYPGCEGKSLHPGFEATLSEDGNEMHLRVEATSVNKDCSMIKLGGWQEATYPRLE